MPKPRNVGRNLERNVERIFGYRVPVLRAAERSRPNGKFYSVYRKTYSRAKDRAEIKAVIFELWKLVLRESRRMLGGVLPTVALSGVDLRGITLELMVGLDGIARGFQAKVLSLRVSSRRTAGVVAAGIAYRACKRLAKRLVTDARATMLATLYKAAGHLLFRWRSLHDKRVRPLHRQLDGGIFSLAKGESTEGLPGQPYGCRCLMEPI